MDKPEIILNLWYVVDDLGVIYSLRARAYLGFGSDDEKLAFLKKFATIDYLIARPFPIPIRFHIEGQPIFHKAALDFLEGPLELFEDAIQALNAELPGQTPFEIQQNPLFCITPLLGTNAKSIRPYFTREQNL